MLDSGKARFPKGVFRTSLDHVNSKVMPNSKHIEGPKRTKFEKKNSVNLFSDSGCLRQQIHSLRVSLSSLRTLQTYHYRHWTPCSPRGHVLALSYTLWQQPCLFHRKVELNDVTQDGGVIARFSSKDFIWLESTLEAETLVSILSL